MSVLAAKKQGAGPDDRFHVVGFSGGAGCDHRITLGPTVEASKAHPDLRCKRQGCETAWPR